jgi:hypothetical protein
MAVGALDIGDRAEYIEHLDGAFAELCAGVQLCERFAVHLGVLADLELGEVEPVGLDLPDQVLDAAEGVALRASGHEGVLYSAEIRQQLFRSPVRPGILRTRRRHSVGEHEQNAAVRLIGRTGGDLVGEFG